MGNHSSDVTGHLVMKDVTEGMREKVDIVMLPHLEMFSIKIFASKKKTRRLK